MLRSRGYNLPLTSRTLGDIIYRDDAVLEAMGCCFYNVVKRSELLPICRKICDTEDKHHKESMRLINDAQEIYDRIQKMKLSQTLIDYLNLKATPAVSA